MMGGLRHWRPQGEHSSDLEWHRIKKRTVCTKNKLNRILGGKRESELGRIQARSSPAGATKGFMHSNTKQINETRRMWISLWLLSVLAFVLLLAQPQPSPCLPQPHCFQWVQELALTYSPVYWTLCYVAPSASLLVIFPVRGEGSILSWWVSWDQRPAGVETTIPLVNWLSPQYKQAHQCQAKLGVLFVGRLSVGMSRGGDTGFVVRVSGVGHEFPQVCTETRRQPPMSSLKSHLPC